MTLIFATHNQNKVREIRALLGDAFVLETMDEAGFTQDIPEPYDSLEENALEKARTVARWTGQVCFSEDSGLEVAALGGAPGTHTGRYAGEGRSDEANNQKLLQNLEGRTDREARFRTVIALAGPLREHCFEGVCPGRIAESPRGSGGFGYDPVFIPEGSDRTFAEMTLEEKNAYSHRRKAFHQLLIFLRHAQNTR